MALTGFATMYAGSLGINPGNILNPDGSVSIGIAPTGNLAANMNNPEGITGSNFRTNNYTGSTNILNSGTPTTPLPNSSVACNVGMNDTYGNPIPFNNPAVKGCEGTLFTPANAPEFYLLGDRTVADKSTSANYWVTIGDNAGVITIPVGIFGVNAVSTMLNTTSGLTTGNAANHPTGSYADIVLRFSSSATGTGSDSYETIALINGVTQRNILSGLGGTASSTSASYTATDMLNANTYSVRTGQVYSSPFTGSSSTPSSGTMVLDYQTFSVLSAYQNMYLVSVTINDNGASTTNREILSALSVTTPEPSTILMFMGGLGALGLARLRRKNS